ncbi:MAG: hypothetical protein KJP21_09005 [Bacteroidia bacterium]|nr:hypothetical protein [Bacteroidia bacterium]NNJ54662.1 hypothetical protein [Bacteroidia bacterium]
MHYFKLITFTILLFGLTTGCSGPSSPSFETLEELKVVSASADKVVLEGKAVYHNPNNITGMLTKTEMKIFINDVEVTEINQNHSIAVPKASDFKVPVSFQFNPKKLREENKGFLRNALKTFLNKKMEVHYKGFVTIEVLRMSFDVPVDYSEKVSLGLRYEDTN